MLWWFWEFAMTDGSRERLGRALTSDETIELAQIQKDPAVVGYALLTLDGDEIEASGAWRSMIAPVFANIFMAVDRIGKELGDEEPCPTLFADSPDFEVAGIRLSNARVLIVKRKNRRSGEGLRSVG